jgi:hypothetical protein
MNNKLKGFVFNPFVVLLAFWGILNLAQARLTPLNNDEAYYWMYSRNLAWGYFDHPPMIALMIRIGYFFIHNELGVRIVVVLTQLATLVLMWKLTNKEQQEKKENILVFFILIALLPVFNIYSFFATPDAPLMLFSAVFLLAYKQFLDEESWRNTFFLGFSAAALMYSKYHSGLLIILIILSNPQLLKNLKFLSAGLFGFLLFLPHLLWQLSNDFPSFRYHLIDRTSGFNLVHVPEYIAGQYSFHNPLIITILIWILIKVKSKNLFDRALYFIITGFFAFFLISSFRYRVEPQWTAVTCVAMVIVLLNNINFKPWLRKYFYRVAIFIIPAILFMRLAAAIDFLPLPILKKEFHNKKQWVSDISKLAADRPVVFTNAYQRPSVYTFYSGKLSHTLDNLNYRKTQFDIWDFEERVHGKEVLYVPHFFNDYYKSNLTAFRMSDGDTIYFRIFKNFQSLQRECVSLNNSIYRFTKSSSNTIHLKIWDPYQYAIDLKHPELPVTFKLAFIHKGNMETMNLKLPDNISALIPGDTVKVDCQFSTGNLPAGKYKMVVCSETGILYNTYSSNFSEAVISD